jgi:DNA ligase-1
MGTWEPTAEDFLRLISPEESAADPGQPYPFYLASPLEKEVTELGDRINWIVEWKWDGIRAQLIKRKDTPLIWSRGEELITDRFPELSASIDALPDGVVLDGEIMGWKDGAPLPFLDLQRRIGRKTVGKKILEDVPVIFMAYDLLEKDHEDQRQQPQFERRRMLESVLQSQPDNSRIPLSPIVEESGWDELAEIRKESRKRGVEGLMLKHRSAAYESGRVRGNWWK